MYKRQGKDTVHFTTEDASGSTSQAAGVVEAMEAGTSLLLMDEDTSATNFMVRDELMQRVICREMEPITPLIDRIRAVSYTHLSSRSRSPAPSPITKPLRSLSKGMDSRSQSVEKVSAPMLAKPPTAYSQMGASLPPTMHRSR